LGTFGTLGTEALLISLLAIDVDGTLLDSRGRVPAANLAVLAEAVSRGIQLAVVTGRSFYFALPAVEQLPEPLTLIVHNGAIARRRTGETLIRRLLPRDVAREVLAATARWRTSAAVMFDRPREGQMVSDRMDWAHPNRARFRERNRDIIEEVPELEHALTEDPIQVAFNGELEPMRTLSEFLQSHTTAPALSVSTTEYAHRDFSLIDVCSAGTTKGKTLERLAGLLGIARADVMAVGDNLNDRDMLAWAGIGVVMGNATAELRSEGFELTGTNDEAGLAQAVRRFAL
jgi:Cof subfamily protein (haloacid dehalogenase superfamily)